MTSKIMPCSMCGKQVYTIDTFSRGECLECHEQNFVFDGKKPNFIKTIVQ